MRREEDKRKNAEIYYSRSWTTTCKKNTAPCWPCSSNCQPPQDLQRKSRCKVSRGFNYWNFLKRPSRFQDWKTQLHSSTELKPTHFPMTDVTSVYYTIIPVSTVGSIARREDTRLEQWTPLTRIHFGPAITVISVRNRLLQIMTKTTLHTLTHLLPLFGLPYLPI